MPLMHLVLIAAAGALGSVLRYLVSRAAQPLGGGAFPAGTLAVNISGALLLGFLASYLLERSTASADVQRAVIIGLIGAYTTFSTFSLETLELLDAGQWWYAALNLSLSVGGGLLAVRLGQTLARV